MKKLMIAAAVALAGVAVNAATFDWASSAMLMQATTATAEGHVADKSMSPSNYLKLIAPIDYTFDVYSMKDEGGVLVKDALVGHAEGKLQSGNFGTSSKISMNDFVVALSPDLATGADFYVESTLSYSDGNYVYTKTGSKQDVISGAGNSSATVVYASGWDASAVPEPTSGLLLLLGVAGLALRRRRA